MKACKQARKTHLSRSNSKHGRQSFCRCVQQACYANPEFVCAWGQQTSAYLPLRVNLCLLQNAYEDLSVELGYQILLDSDEE